MNLIDELTGSRGKHPIRKNENCDATKVRLPVESEDGNALPGRDALRGVLVRHRPPLRGFDPARWPPPDRPLSADVGRSGVVCAS
jgi:hypothetical protein